jgi:hypothetical protein
MGKGGRPAPAAPVRPSRAAARGQRAVGGAGQPGAPIFQNFDSAPSALARIQPALRAVFRTQPAPFGAGQNTEPQNTEHTS